MPLFGGRGGTLGGIFCPFGLFKLFKLVSELSLCVRLKPSVVVHDIEALRRSTPQTFWGAPWGLPGICWEDEGLSERSSDARNDAV